MKTVSEASLRPITSAKIAVIPPEEREEAIATMARAAGPPTLRPVDAGTRALTGDPDLNDVVIGMYARVGYGPSQQLTGIVRLRERYRRSIGAVGTLPSKERTFLIDALEIADTMAGWHPPLRTLLVATAMMVIATISHDPSFRTYVACRVDEQDCEAPWLTILGGHPLAVPDNELRRWTFGDIPTSELRFLDTDAACVAAALVHDHMTGGVFPSHRYDLPGRAQSCRAMLSVAFPRAFTHLETEISLLASGDIDLGWRTPVIAGNDSFPLRAHVG